jgi:hypothetical protein
MVDLEREELGAAQAAADQQREHGAIAFALEGGGVGRVEAHWLAP